MRRKLFTLAAGACWLLGTAFAASGIVSNLTSGAEDALGAVLLYVTLWSACTAIALATVFAVHRMHRNDERANLGLCPRCGYDLRATPAPNARNTRQFPSHSC